MINVDKLFSMNKEEYIEFLNSKNIYPIDDIILYKGIKYQLTKEDMQSLNLRRISMGYEWNYSGPEKNNGDAETINGMMLAALTHIKGIIDNHIEHNCLEYKIIE